MKGVCNLHQYTHYIGKFDVTSHIFSTSNRHFDFPDIQTDYFDEDKKYDFRDRLHELSRKDRDTSDKEDIFLMKAVSDYLLAVVKSALKEKNLEIEKFDLLHYAFIVPSEWEEEMRNDIIRPIFVQSGLISNKDHQDRLLFFTDIECICYRYSFERRQNTILCRISSDEGKVITKLDMIQSTNTLYNFPNAKFFPKVTNSSSVSITIADFEDRIKEFLRDNLFPVVIDDGRSRKPINNFLKTELLPSKQDQLIQTIMKEILSKTMPLDEENNEDKQGKTWITVQNRLWWSERQKKFINSLSPASIRAEISSFLIDKLKGIISNNFTKSYKFLLVMDEYSYHGYEITRAMRTWLAYILDYDRRSLNSTVIIVTRIDPDEKKLSPEYLIEGAGVGIFEAIQHSDIHCNPCIIPLEDSTTSSSVFLSSKPDAIVNLDISLGSTLLTYSILNKDGLIQQIFDHDYLIADNLPPLGHFYTFSNTTTLNIKEQFIPFAERYLLGDLADFTADDGISIKKDLLFEMKAILNKEISKGETLISTYKPKYINAFVLMYMIYIKEEILNKLPDHLISEHTNTKIGYAISIEAMLLKNTIGTKDSLQGIIFASGLVPKVDDSKKLRITTQGERILPAIQKSLKLEFSLKSYFLVCQLHEDYVQLSLHQVVTAPSSEEEEQESIIVQNEILDIPNIYDSLCTSMWQNLVQDSSLIELCEMHITSDDNKSLDLFSSKIKEDFFMNLKSHISDNVRAVNKIQHCNCEVRLTTIDIIDIAFTPVLQDIGCTLFASLLNKELFGNYINIDYLFSIMHFNNNPQLQYAFSRILEEEADDFNLELGIDTSCLVIPKLFSQLLRPVIAQQPLLYNDFKIGALQQDKKLLLHKKIFRLKTVDNLEDKDNNIFLLKTMNNLKNIDATLCDAKIFQRVDKVNVYFPSKTPRDNVDLPVTISLSYVPHAASLQFSVKLVGADTRDKKLAGVIETGEPLTLSRF
ncbi:hypothetical protein HPULCUR_005602 [Helicostylum pulchrum]|uniref:Uncharacterized protein n=1 Tax=Helicostylum pulchrum TaxID=562976 RepID=A0ABP9XZI6_9FUNG